MEICIGEGVNGHQEIVYDGRSRNCPLCVETENVIEKEGRIKLLENEVHDLEVEVDNLKADLQDEKIKGEK